MGGARLRRRDAELHLADRAIRAGRPGPGPAAGRAAHWNGSNWRTLRFPPLPPAVRRRAAIGNAAIQAFSARDAWVDIGLTTATASDGAIVWHWNGRAWSRVPVPYRTQAAGDISQDGRGGIWMYAIGPASATGAPAYLYHYSKGQWSRQRAPALDGQASEMGVLSWSPGARSGWAAAGTGTRGLLLRYFPRGARARQPRRGGDGAGSAPARPCPRTRAWQSGTRTCRSSS